MFLLDTDHVSILQDDEGAESAKLVERLTFQAESGVVLSIISFHEQTLGAHSYINRAVDPAVLLRGYELMFQVTRTFSLLPILPFDADADADADAAFEELARKRLRVGTMELRIAAIALSHDLTLLTRNVADFGKVPGLRTEDWTR